MQVYKMRARVKSVYPSPKWESKVNKMTDGQIIAIYHTMIRQGKIKQEVYKCLVRIGVIPDMSNVREANEKGG